MTHTIKVDPKRVEDLPADEVTGHRSGKWYAAFAMMAADPGVWYELRRLTNRSAAATTVSNFANRLKVPEGLDREDFEFTYRTWTDDADQVVHAVYGRFNG